MDLQHTSVLWTWLRSEDNSYTDQYINTASLILNQKTVLQLYRKISTLDTKHKVLLRFNEW